MSLAVYLSPDENDKVSSTNPFTITFDGRVGGIQSKKIYIRNDDITKWYSSIGVVAIDNGSGDSRVDGSRDEFEWKLLEKDVPPEMLEWRDVTAGNSISFTDEIGDSSFGDTSTFLPVWVYVRIPRGQSIQTITDIIFRLTATENLI